MFNIYILFFYSLFIIRSLDKSLWRINFRKRHETERIFVSLSLVQFILTENLSSLPLAQIEAVLLLLFLFGVFSGVRV